MPKNEREWQRRGSYLALLKRLQRLQRLLGSVLKVAPDVVRKMRGRAFGRVPACRPDAGERGSLLISKASQRSMMCRTDGLKRKSTNSENRGLSVAVFGDYTVTGVE